MMETEQDRRYMARAIELAKKGLYTTDPNPRVGCVLVKHDQIVGEGWHAVAGGPHAEVNALAQAQGDAQGATAYVTLEPCAHYGKTPPCANALVAAGVSRVVIGSGDPNPQVGGQGIQILQQAGIEVTQGVLQTEAEALNPGFLKRMRTGLPWVRCKMAMSLDGRTAMADGESQWITGPPARQDVQRLRARSSAVLTGIGTVMADDPSLTVREALLEEPVRRQPLRIVLDSALRLSPTAKLFETDTPVWVITLSDNVEQIQALEAVGARVMTCESNSDDGRRRLNLRSVLQLLGSEGCNEVLVESGAVLAGGFVEQGLLDELIIYIAPCLMGSEARALFSLPTINRMADKQSLQITNVRPVGQDWRMTCEFPVADQ